MSNSSEEIDFEPILNRIYNAVKKRLNTLGSFVKFLFSKWYIVFLFALLFGGIGYGISHLVKPYFKVFMTISSSNTGILFLESSVANLNNMAESENAEGLSAILGLSVEQASSIKEIQAIKSNTYAPEGNSDAAEHIYYIQADIYDREILPDLESSLYQLLENNKFVKNKREERRLTYQKRLERARLDILSIDSILIQLSRSVVSGRAKDKSVIMNDLINPTELLQEKKNQYDLVIFYENQLNSLTDTEIISGFNYAYKPAFPKKLFFAIYGALTGMFISLVFLGFKYNDRTL